MRSCKRLTILINDKELIDEKDTCKIFFEKAKLNQNAELITGVIAVRGWSFIFKEQNISLTGLVDGPVILDVDRDVATGTIVVEFSPKSAYRFFNFQLSDIANRIYSVSDIFVSAATQLEEQISNVKNIEGKVTLLQQFLLKQLMLAKE